MDTIYTIVGSTLGFFGYNGILLLVFRMFHNRITNIEAMLKDYVPDDDYKRFINGQEKKMNSLVARSEFEACQNHCASEFSHGKERDDRVEDKVDSIIEELKPISEGVSLLMDRAKRFRDTDL